MPRKAGTILTKPDARRAAGAFNAAPAPKQSTPVADAISDYLISHERQAKSPSYLRELTYYLTDRDGQGAWTPLGRWCKLHKIIGVAELTKPVLDRYFESVRSTGTPGVYQKVVKIVRRFLRWMVDDEGLLTAMPMTIKPPADRESNIPVFSVDDMQKIARVVSKENVRDWAIFMLLVDTGMRVGELVKLKVGDFHWSTREVYIEGSITKTKTARPIPLTSSVQALRKYLAVRGSATKPVDTFFLSFLGSPVDGGGRRRKTGRKQTGKCNFAARGLSTNGVYQLVAKWGKLAKIVDARSSPHTFRHYFAIEFLRNGGDVLSLQRILGHSKLEMTQRYAKLANVDVSTAHRKYTPGAAFVSSRYTAFNEPTV